MATTHDQMVCYKQFPVQQCFPTVLCLLRHRLHCVYQAVLLLSLDLVKPIFFSHLNLYLLEKIKFKSKETLKGFRKTTTLFLKWQWGRYLCE